MAKKTPEEDLTVKDTICSQICTDLSEVTSERSGAKVYCRMSLQQAEKRDRGTERYAGQSASNDDNNVPEQKAMTVDTQGYERPFEDISQKRPRTSFRSGQSYRKRWLISRTSERDNVSSEVEILKEKSQPRLSHELKEIFYDKPGLLDAKQLQKISEKAGRDPRNYCTTL